LHLAISGLEIKITYFSVANLKSKTDKITVTGMKINLSSVTAKANFAIEVMMK